MEPDAKKKAAIAALHDEMDSIHLFNQLYWKEKAHTHESNAEYQRRLDRLEQIRKEIAALR